MPDLSGRSEFEKKLANALGKRLDAALEQLANLLGDPPSLENVPETFWDDFGLELDGDLRGELARVYAQSGVQLGNQLRGQYQVEVGRSVDWNLVNKGAAVWAKDYAFDLVKGINDSSRERLEKAVASFFEDQLTMGDLRDLLGSIFGPERAALIATTEVTRAAMEGELNTVNWIEEDSNIRMQATFATSEDEHVCDECDPLDGTEVEEEDYPPVHPGCRCWINWEPRD